MEHPGKPGAGAFQWNCGGWFGSQLGATLWLVILGVLLLAQSRPAGSLVLAFGLVPNLVGLALWFRRETLSPYVAVQILLGACGTCALGAMLCLHYADGPNFIADLPSPWFLLIYPGLMLSFHFRERSARKHSA